MAASEANFAWQVGEWLVDPATDTFARGSETVKIEPRTMRLLVCLAESAGSVVSVDRLLEEVWAGVIVGPASVYQAVSQLRRILGDVGEQPSYIATVSKKGYRLVAPVGRVVREAPQPLTVRLVKPVPQPETAAAPPALPPPAPSAKWWHGRRLWIVVGATLGVLAAVLWYPARILLDRTPASVSMVVLPMLDLTAEGKDGPLCDGLTEDLSNWLAQLPTLRVVARTSANLLRDRSPDIRAIGKQLGVTHVLRSTLSRRNPGNIVIAMQLYDTRDAYQLWTAQVERPIGDIAQIQSETVQAVAANLELRLTEAATQQLMARNRADAEAFMLYLLAQHYQALLTRNDNEHAIELYQQAIAREAKLAPALVGLAWARINQNIYLKRPREELAASVEPLLDDALRIEPDRAEAYAARGALRGVQRRFAEALADLERAVNLNPNDIRALTELGYVHGVRLGQPVQALQAYDQAALVDPLNVNVHARRCSVLTDLARLQEADLACARARALHPGGAWAYETTSWSMAARGQLDEALRWNALAIKADPHILRLYLTRVSLLLSLGLHTRAGLVLDRALVETGDGTGVGDMRPMVAFYAGGERALREALAAIDLGPSPGYVREMQFADYWLLLKDYRRADELLMEALRDADAQADLDNFYNMQQGNSFLPLVAVVKSATGDTQSAMAALDKLSAMLASLDRAGVRRFGVQELHAVEHALRGAPDAAMTNLERAAAMGWRRSWMSRREAYLAPLWKRGDFEALLRRVDATNAAQATTELGEP